MRIFSAEAYEETVKLMKIERNMLPEAVYAFAKLLYTAGYEVFLVGGMVRDLLLDPEAARDESDYDFATSARPEEVQKLFRRTIPTGIEHGTVTVLFRNFQFEVTTYRSDGTYSDGRHPDSIGFSDTIEEDLKRRDFTVNAMALDLESFESLSLKDPFGGQEDLEKRCIRAVGDPLRRFQEDGLRPMRACRFASTLSGYIEKATFAAIGERLAVFRQVANERIHDEFVKILQSEKPSIGIEALRTSGLLAEFLPELLEGFEVEQNEYHLYDVYYHNLYSCDAGPRDDYRIRLAALLHDIGKVRAMQAAERRNPEGEGPVFHNHEMISMRMARKILLRLKFSNADRDFVLHLIKHHMFYYTDEWTDGAVRRLMRNVGVEYLESLFRLRLADRAGNGKKQGIPKSLDRLQERIAAIQEADNAITVKDLAINGNDLMEHAGLPPSPLIGDILEYLLEKILDTPELNSREELLKLADTYLENREADNTWSHRRPDTD